MNAVEVLPSGPFGAALCAGLYALTYLSFVRLLRYPRNWLAPPISSSLATAALAALTVALASLSDDGLKLPDLAASSPFIGLPFFIIPAPAIAFHPAPTLIDFLSNHRA